MGCIYRMKFPNGKVYIGQTIRKFTDRKRQHKNRFCQWQKMEENERKKKAIPLFYAINKYGFENIKWDILEENINTKSELNEREIYWIRKERAYIRFKDSMGYNATLGGASREEFTVLDEDGLKCFGEDFKKGMTREDLRKKYPMGEDTMQAICNGRRWSYYTGIQPKSDIIPVGSTLLPSDVDKVIELFKEKGTIKEVHIELQNSHTLVKNSQPSYSAIRKIIMGETWSDYTHIYDNSFYNKYKNSYLYSKEELQNIINMFYQDSIYPEDILRKYPSLKRITTLNSILRGETFSEYTHIKKYEWHKKHFIPPLIMQGIAKEFTNGIQYQVAEKYSLNVNVMRKLIQEWEKCPYLLENVINN